MAGNAAERMPTFDELYARIRRLAPGLTGEILEPGVLRVMSRPGRAHRRAQKLIVAALGGKDRDRGGAGWWIEEEAEVRFSSSKLAVPDIAGWRVERVAELPDDNPILVLPDWCCEILSPSKKRDDRRLKLPLYAARDVGHVWLVSTEQRLVEVYESRAGKPTQIATGAEGETVALPPFDDVAIDLARLWTPPRG